MTGLMLSHEQLANVLIQTLLPLRTEGSIKLPLCRVFTQLRRHINHIT